LSSLQATFILKMTNLPIWGYATRCQKIPSWGYGAECDLEIWGPKRKIEVKKDLTIMFYSPIIQQKTMSYEIQAAISKIATHNLDLYAPFDKENIVEYNISADLDHKKLKKLIDAL